MNLIGIILSYQKWNNDQYVVKLLIMTQYDRNPRDFYNLEVKLIECKYHRKIYNGLKQEDRQVIELDFGYTLDKVTRKYLDIYDRGKSVVLCTTKF